MYPTSQYAMCPLLLVLSTIFSMSLLRLNSLSISTPKTLYYSISRKQIYPMALFPSGEQDSPATESSGKKRSIWLQNPSFDSTIKSKITVSPLLISTSQELLKSTDKKFYDLSKKNHQIDRGADKANFSYDSLYSGDVSSYCRKFPVLGLTTKQSISLDDGRGKGKGSKKNLSKKMTRYFAVPLASCEECVLTMSNCSMENIMLFDNEAVMSNESYLHKKMAEYNRVLTENPTNVELWLEFIAAQDWLQDWGQKEEAMNERKMAIFERALVSNPRSVKLLLGHMAIASTCWESKAVLKRWKEVVFTFPNVPLLWLGYIDFCQSNFATFSVDSVAALYSKCISTLSKIQEGTLKSHAPLPDNQLWTISIFERYCKFLKSCGFVEWGFASYQALLELNLCTPPELSEAPLCTKLAQLASYWESRAPKLSEHDACGWNSKGTPLGPLDISIVSDCFSSEDDVELVAGLSEKEAWLKLEYQRSEQHCLPWVSCEEPIDGERIVGFELIKPAMFCVDSLELKLELVMRFLQFLGALTPPLMTPAFCPPHTMEQSIELSAHTSSTLSSLLTESMCIPPGLSVSELVCENLSELVESLSNILLHSASKLKPSLVSSTISRVCHQTLSLFPSEQAQTQLALVWCAHTLWELMAAQSKTEQKDKKKFAQKLIKSLLKLKIHRNNLQLWKCCALMEYLIGNDCVAIFETLLSSSLTAPLVSSFVEVAISLVPRLLPGYELPNGSQVAINALLCLCEGKYSSNSPITPTRILKAEFGLCESPLHLFHTSLCKAYFEYLTRGISSACATLEEACTSLSTHSDLIVALRCKQVRLLLHSPLAEPRTLRKVLDSALLTCPTHSYFLATKLLLEEQSYSVGRIDRDTSKSSQSQLFRILQELRRLERMAELSGSSKGALRRAVSFLDSSVGNHPLLWRIYLILQSLVDPSQLSTLVYRAVHACPSSKALYLDCARLLPVDQLNKILELIDDKGIRLRTPIEEIQLLLVE